LSSIERVMAKSFQCAAAGLICSAPVTRGGGWVAAEGGEHPISLSRPRLSERHAREFVQTGGGGSSDADAQLFLAG